MTILHSLLHSRAHVLFVITQYIYFNAVPTFFKATNRFAPRIIVQGGAFSSRISNVADHEEEYLNGVKESATNGFDILRVSFSHE